MDRKEFLKNSLIAGTGMWMPKTFTNQKETKIKKSLKPNIVVILVDDLRWDDLGVTGHNYIKTPHIDRIALEGGVFRNAFTTTPLCSPSRASLLTGQYAHHHGVIDNTDHSALSHHLPTFPAKLNSIGYKTAFIGKWHMGNDPTPRPGFDFWAALPGQGQSYDPQLNVNGNMVNHEGYVTDILHDYSINFINQAKKEPFCLFVAEKALHPNLEQDNQGHIHKISGGGFVPAKKYKGMYANEIFDRRFNSYVTPRDKPALMRKIDDLPILGKETATPENDIRGRAEMLMSVDEGVGKIMDVLQKQGELENTLILFTSDEGYFYGEHGLNEVRRLAYEESCRIPLLIRYPGMIKKRTIYNEMMLNIDIAPTLIELAGDKPDKFIDGKSFLPLLKDGKDKDSRSSFLIEYYTDDVWPRMVNMGYKAIRTKRYKYIRYTDLNGMNELYDLQIDPFELTNQINSPMYKQIQKKLQKSLDEYVER